MDGLSGRLGAPHSPWISRWSRHSRRSVPAYRSAKEFARGDRTGDLMIRTLLPANTSSNVLVNLPSRSRIRNLKRSARAPRSIRRFRACWAVQAPVGLAVTPRTRAPGFDLHDEEDVQALEEHCVYVEEVARQDPRRLRRQELPPGR